MAIQKSSSVNKLKVSYTHKNYSVRIKKISKLLKETKSAPSALLVSSAAQITKSWDSHFDYRQNSDFYYLTGSKEQDLALLIFSDQNRTPILFSKKRDKFTIVWEGPAPSAKSLADKLNCNFVESSDIEKEIFQTLKNIEDLYTHKNPESISNKIATKLDLIPRHRRYGYPTNILSAESVIEILRLYKEPEEVTLIEEAIRVTYQGLQSGVALIKPNVEEESIKIAIENRYRELRAIPGFSTIVGAGVSASTLHYWRHERKAKKGDAILIDCGAELNMYNGDITRCYPVDGKFSPIMQEIYSIVLEAQKASIKAVKNNVKIETVYNASAKILTEGLVELKVLKGKVSKLLEKKAFQPFFPHGIGHSLGIDVHDVGNLRGNNNAVLKKGMVFTIEPGIYFPKAVGRAPACGIRIEDNILVTENGCKILSDFIPK